MINNVTEIVIVALLTATIAVIVYGGFIAVKTLLRDDTGRKPAHS
jgi:carbon starvation protein CstA